MPGTAMAVATSPVAQAGGAGGGVVDWSTWFDHFYIAKGAASLAASYADLVGSNTLVAGSAPSSDLTAGWIMNGTAYLRTNLLPAANWSALVLYSDATANDVYLLGAVGTGTNDFRLVTRAFADALRWFYANSNKTGAPNHTSGVMGLVGPTGYYNGVAQVSSIGTFTGTGDEIYLGAHNNGGTPNFAGTSKIQAVGFKAGLIADPAAASAAMLAL